ELGPGQHAEPGMQPLLGGKEPGGGDGCRSRGDHVATHRKGTETEDEEHRDECGHPRRARALGLPPAEQRRRTGEGEEGDGKRNRPDLAAQEPPDTAGKADKRERAEAGGALALLLVTLAPAALDADQE